MYKLDCSFHHALSEEPIPDEARSLRRGAIRSHQFSFALDSPPALTTAFRTTQQVEMEP